LFVATIHVTLKPTVNDPQGQTILSTLQNMGFVSAISVRTGKQIEIQLDSTDQKAAQSEVQSMCDNLLSNPIIEEFNFTLIKKE